MSTHKLPRKVVQGSSSYGIFHPMEFPPLGTPMGTPFGAPSGFPPGESRQGRLSPKMIRGMTPLNNTKGPGESSSRALEPEYRGSEPARPLPRDTKIFGHVTPRRGPPQQQCPPTPTSVVPSTPGSTVPSTPLSALPRHMVQRTPKGSYADFVKRHRLPGAGRPDRGAEAYQRSRLASATANAAPNLANDHRQARFPGGVGYRGGRAFPEQSNNNGNGDSHKTSNAQAPNAGLGRRMGRYTSLPTMKGIPDGERYSNRNKEVKWYGYSLDKLLPIWEAAVRKYVENGAPRKVGPVKMVNILCFRGIMPVHLSRFNPGDPRECISCAIVSYSGTRFTHHVFIDGTGTLSVTDIPE